MEKSCIDCGSRSCFKSNGAYPPFCVSRQQEQELLEEVKNLYLEDEENHLFAIESALMDVETYCQLTRVEEIVDFARRIGAKKLGIATCVGLMSEARTAAQIFRHAGFEVFGVACKCGELAKVDLGLPEHCTTIGGKNVCNPILQAKILNRQKTDLNIVIGLCVGHDSLFYKYAEAMCTTLVTKDRVLGHNPVAALYQADKYYAGKLFKDE